MQDDTSNVVRITARDYLATNACRAPLIVRYAQNSIWTTHWPRSRALKPGLIRFFFHQK